MSNPPAWVTNAGGDAVFGARPARWGFRHETWIVDVTDGSAFVVQRRVDGSDPTRPRARAIRDVVRAAGLPVPEPTRRALVAGDVVVTMPFVDGVVAAELLGTNRGAQIVGRVCGEVGARLGAVNPKGVPLPRTWASGDSLRVATHARMERLPHALLTGTRRDLLVALDHAVLEVDAVKPRLAHGDLAPVNVLVLDDRLTAVLDLDRAQLAHPLYDAAWFAWVVSFHHAAVAEAACEAYAGAAGITLPSFASMAWMWRLQLLERLAEAPNAQERARWAARLAAVQGSA
jgi:aminoglycoside phosphotransferase (APT) family kinase protein